MDLISRPQSEAHESPEVCEVCCKLGIHTHVSQGIHLTSEAHTSLFMHDEEMMNHFNSQLDIAHQNVIFLEEKLRNSNEDCEFARKQQYQSEVAWFNEAQGRTSAQRHLRLEQHRYDECAEAYESLTLQHGSMESDMQAMFTLNEMLRQEVEHGQRIIDSMAGNISELERVANGFVAFARQPFQPTARWDSMAGSPDADKILTPTSAPPNLESPSLMAFSVSPTVGDIETDIEDTPQLSTMRIGAILESKAGVKKSRKPKKRTTARVTVAEPRGWMKVEETL
jgi:hypothetical protein